MRNCYRRWFYACVFTVFIEAEQERSRRIEPIRKKSEFAKEAGSSITEQILLFLADEMVEHLSEIDYELRMKFELYVTPLIKRNYITDIPERSTGYGRRPTSGNG